MSCESSHCVSRLVRRAPKRGIIPLDHIPFPCVHTHRCFIRTVWIRYDNKRECMIHLVHIDVPVNVTGASRSRSIPPAIAPAGTTARPRRRDSSPSVGRVASRRVVSSRLVRAFARSPARAVPRSASRWVSRTRTGTRTSSTSTRRRGGRGRGRGGRRRRARRLRRRLEGARAREGGGRSRRRARRTRRGR